MPDILSYLLMEVTNGPEIAPPKPSTDEPMLEAFTDCAWFSFSDAGWSSMSLLQQQGGGEKYVRS